MKNIINNIARFRDSESAATSTEYALLLAAISGFLLVTLVAFGNESGTFWGNTADAINTITR